MLGKIERRSPDTKRHPQSLGNKSLTKIPNPASECFAIADILAKKGCSPNLCADSIAQPKQTVRLRALKKVRSTGSPPTYHP
ncbi:hypothetical protein [Microcoleus sp. bin38.metabat.b11b12b14.051]|uniref:hypothetical protein n=1 Tax=Microcoleus sp. bin38.metabat.b11b12b14.051 TaxID=2742709 RepID=UPI0025D5DCD1|nr:hypothetical protein [Microcoleus sp. bin38.metabat.b11b12b14.051]